MLNKADRQTFDRLLQITPVPEFKFGKRSIFCSWHRKGESVLTPQSDKSSN